MPSANVKKNVWKVARTATVKTVNANIAIARKQESVATITARKSDEQISPLQNDKK
jgi:hypothetical protein